MSVVNAAAVDIALVGALAADATLTALVPDGIWLDVGTRNMTRYVVVQHQIHTDDDGFGGTLYETFRYRITARVLQTTGGDVNAAADRIHQILQDQLLTIAGYTHGSTLRVERVKTTEIDPVDNDIRWQVAGGDYELFVSPN